MANTTANGRAPGIKNNSTVNIATVLAIWSDGKDVSANDVPMGRIDPVCATYGLSLNPIISTNTCFNPKVDMVKNITHDNTKLARIIFRLALNLRMSAIIITNRSAPKNGIRLMNFDIVSTKVPCQSCWRNTTICVSMIIVHKNKCCPKNISFSH